MSLDLRIRDLSIIRHGLSEESTKFIKAFIEDLDDSITGMMDFVLSHTLLEGGISSVTMNWKESRIHLSFIGRLIYLIYDFDLNKNGDEKPDPSTMTCFIEGSNEIQIDKIKDLLPKLVRSLESSYETNKTS